MFEILFDPSNPIAWLLIIAIIAGAMAIMSRPFSTYVKFVYPNAKYEAMGNPYIKKGSLQKLIEISNIQQLIETLNSDKEYKLQESENETIQEQIDQHLIDTIQQMKKDHSKKMHQFFDSYLEKKDTLLIKTMFHQIHQQKTIDASLLRQQTISQKNKTFINKLIEASEEQIPIILKQFGFQDDLIKSLKNEETLSLQIDAKIDAYMINHLEAIKVPYKCKEGKHLYLARYKDILSVQHLLRAKHLKYHEKICNALFVGDGYEIPKWKFEELCKSESVAEVINQLEGTRYYQSLKQTYDKQDERNSVQGLTTSLDTLLLTFMKEISQQYYSNIGPTLRFLVSKELEIINLKIISKGLIEKLPSDLILPLLIMEVET